MNKKAQDVEAIHILFRGIILLVIVGVFTPFLYMSNTGTRSITPAQAEILTYRLLSDPEGIIYEHNTRAYPGIIDLDKYNEDRLKKSMNFTYGPRPSMKLDLKLLGESSERTMYLNQEQYRRLLPTSIVGGLGRSYSLRKTVPVLVRVGDSYKEADLDIHVLAVRQ